MYRKIYARHFEYQASSDPDLRLTQTMGSGGYIVTAKAERDQIREIPMTGLCFRRANKISHVSGYTKRLSLRIVRRVRRPKM